jgi:hypothetical protein
MACDLTCRAWCWLAVSFASFPWGCVCRRRGGVPGAGSLILSGGRGRVCTVWAGLREWRRCRGRGGIPRRTRAGVSVPGSWGRCQGSRRSAASAAASRSWVQAVMISQVHRSAAAGSRSSGASQPRVCLKNRKVCSPGPKPVPPRAGRPGRGVAGPARSPAGHRCRRPGRRPARSRSRPRPPRAASAVTRSAGSSDSIRPVTTARPVSTARHCAGVIRRARPAAVVDARPGTGVIC